MLVEKDLVHFIHISSLTMKPLEIKRSEGFTKIFDPNVNMDYHISVPVGHSFESIMKFQIEQETNYWKQQVEILQRQLQAYRNYNRRQWEQDRDYLPYADSHDRD